jgi:tRNA-binding protein
MIISYEDFEKVDLRSGTVIKVEPFPRAKKPAYKVWIDFGSTIGIKQTSAQITVHYTLETLLGKKVIACINLGERNIAGFISQCLMLGFADSDNAICLATIDGNISNGQKLH